MGLDKTFKDFDNNFSCDTIEEWSAHLGTVEKTYTGSIDCVTCGEPVTLNWTGKLKNGKLFPNVLCKECKEQ
jgi:formylmethanofuran dehydrogenase subunit E